MIKIRSNKPENDITVGNAIEIAIYDEGHYILTFGVRKSPVGEVEVFIPRGKFTHTKGDGAVITDEVEVQL